MEQDFIVICSCVHLLLNDVNDVARQRQLQQPGVYIVNDLVSICD